MNTNHARIVLGLSLAALFASPSLSVAQDGMEPRKPAMSSKHETSPFKGVEVNGGRAIHWHEKGKSFLSVSSDFKLPKSPAPHWQVVDGKGNIHLLKQFNIVGGKSNKTIEVPGYITDIAKVQVWCSFAEVLLGEAKFVKPVTSHR